MNEQKNNHAHHDHADTEAMSDIFVQFYDAIGSAIQGLVARFEWDGGVFAHTSDGSGKIPPFKAPMNSVIDIFVAKQSGGEKKIGSLSITGTKTVSNIFSSKVKVSEKTKQPTKPAKQAKQTAPVKPQRQVDDKGEALVAVPVECPNADNLRLGPNSLFREHILKAAKRANMAPQGIAALIDAEASKLKNLQWNPRASAGSRSSARGMTQFLSGTWIDEALRQGTYLHDKATKEGYIAKDTKGTWCLVLSNGKLIKITSKTKRATYIDDSRVTKLLDLRYDPEFAIMAAVDYGLHNMAGLERAGYSLSSLNDAEKAKILYLTHHLGLSDAKRFVQNALLEDDEKNTKGKVIRLGARSLLEAQVGKNNAIDRADKAGDFVKAHRRWLDIFVESKILLKRHCCDESKAINAKTLLEICSSLKL